MRQVGLVLAGASVVAGVVWFGLNGRDHSPAEAKERSLQSLVGPESSAAAAPEKRSVESKRSVSPPKAPARARPEPNQAARRKLADELRRKLAALYGTKGDRSRAEAPASEAAPRMPRPVGSGNQAKNELGAYIQSVVREQFVPVAGNCYEQLLERDPQATGDIVLELSIVGNDDLGGVVETVEVDEEASTLEEEEFVTCVRESMYTTMFDAPPDGQNSVTVKYPFSFSP